MALLKPEQQSRLDIDRILQQSGWMVQDYRTCNPGAGPGVAIREYPTDTGPADYILFIDRQAVGVIEAKPAGTTLIKVEDQTERYAASHLKWQIETEPLRFLYQSTGVETRFTDNRDPKPRSRETFTFHRPETLREWLNQPDTLRTRLTQLPELNPGGLRDCQVRAIRNLDRSFADNRPRALIQMATGSGKTYTAITVIYRLLKFAEARRILFLVDTRNLGQQADQEMQAYIPSDDRRKFTELYNVQRLRSNAIDPVSQVCISTIQRMYSILRGEEMDESAEERSHFEMRWQDEKPREVVYNPRYPMEFFDFIIIDECHRSIYNIWQQVLDYFDAFLIGLTATPDNRTFGFFKQNVVSEYSHEEAVADGVNVGYDVYTIETEITQKGSKIAAEKKVKKKGKTVTLKQYVEKRSRLTRQKRWEQLDEDVTYSGQQLDRDVVNKSQIRTVIRTFKDKLQTEIFPNRKEVPKTLIFAKTDSHADDIIQIVREEFGEGNRFCKKVTYNVRDEKPEDVLAAFRTSYNPRIAVTVDMIATGTDVKPIECLLFMRDVRSKNYFEQMKGRGTRTFDVDDLRRVTPSATTNKTHFVIVDAVGVCKSLKTDSRPLERKKSVPLKDLMQAVIMNHRDEDTLLSLANRLTRLDKQLQETDQQKIEQQTGGKKLSALVHGLLDAYNPDAHIEKARDLAAFEGDAQEFTPTAEQLEQARTALLETACQPFDNPDLRQLIVDIKTSYDQIIDDINLDTVGFSGFDPQAKQNAEKAVTTFKQFLEENKNEITALQIFYHQPYKRRALTFNMIKELTEALHKPPYLLTVDRLWSAYRVLEQNKVRGASAKKMLTDIISLVRHAAGQEEELMPFNQTVNERFADWLNAYEKRGQKLTPEQTEWLTMIKDHIAASISIDKEDFDNAPFYEKGGLMKVWQLFGEDLDGILEEMNMKLVA
ncbi:MAG: type I restriction-modification enzyme R subunit C-terminal domain-containing protein [bacterium]